MRRNATRRITLQQDAALLGCRARAHSLLVIYVPTDTIFPGVCIRASLDWIIACGYRVRFLSLEALSCERSFRVARTRRPGGMASSVSILVTGSPRSGVAANGCEAEVGRGGGVVCHHPRSAPGRRRSGRRLGCPAITLPRSMSTGSLLVAPNELRSRADRASAVERIRLANGLSGWSTNRVRPPPPGSPHSHTRRSICPDLRRGTIVYTVRFLLRTLRDSLSVCGGESMDDSHTTSAENTERRRIAHTTMRCFLVLTFWTVIFSLIVTAVLFGSPRLLRLLGLLA